MLKVFVDNDHHLWSVHDNGSTNYPGPITIGLDKVVVREEVSLGYEEVVEYALWASLAALENSLNAANH